MKAEIYKDINISAPLSKLKKLAKGQAINLTASDLKEGDKHLKVHHLMHKKMMTARRNNKGCRLMLSEPEIHASGSLWDDIKSGLATAGKFLGTAALDGIQDATKAVTGNSPLGNRLIDSIRGKVKDVTGLGVKQVKKPKKAVSSEEMKARMAKVRSFKKNHKGGSFLLGNSLY